MTRRDLGGGFELDDDKGRIDLHEVHRYLCDESYWAAGRPVDVQERLVREAARGTRPGRRHPRGRRTRRHRSRRGFGQELVREMIDHGPFAATRWLLHTTSMHPLYRKFGFSEPDYKLMERPRTSQASDSG